MEALSFFMLELKSAATMYFRVKAFFSHLIDESGGDVGSVNIYSPQLKAYLFNLTFCLALSYISCMKGAI